MGAWRYRGEGWGEVKNDSQLSGLDSWMEDGAEEGKTEEEQVRGGGKTAIPPLFCW